MADVFISYSHRDQQFALQLVGALTQHGYTTWFDKNDVFSAGAFREDIKAGIEEAGAFLFVLSPDFLISEKCGKELDCAQACKKKLIPLLHCDIDRSSVPQTLRDLDWIKDPSFDRVVEKILDAFLIDKEDWKQAGWWLRRGNEWDKNRKQNSGLLLYGKELKKAEDWLRRAEHWRLEGSSKKPQPQPSHIQFIRESRRAANRAFLLRMTVFLLLMSLTAGGAFSLLYHNPTLVTTLKDDGPGSLRQAVANVNPGSTITFAANLRGTLVLTSGMLNIEKKNISITAPGLGNLIVKGFGIHINAQASVTLSNFVFDWGTIKTNGSGDTIGRVTLINCIITHGATGIFNTGGVVTLVNSTVSDHTSGGIYSGLQGTINLINSTVSNNTSSSCVGDTGGGIGIDGGTLTLTNSTVSGNTINLSPLEDSDFINCWEMGGGGIHVDGSDKTNLIINNSLIYGNRSLGGNGGGIFITSCGISPVVNITITNSTIANNSAKVIHAYDKFSHQQIALGGQGGGISLECSLKGTLTFSTIYGNTAQKGGGLALKSWYPDDTIDVGIGKSLVVGNRADTATSILGPWTSDGYNLIQDTPDEAPTDEAISVQGLDKVFSQSIEPQEHGGPTKTYPLLLGTDNPAIGKIPLTACHLSSIFNNQSHTYIDQRGMRRPGGKKQQCDIGAYETQESS